MDYIASKLPPKPGLTGKRVFVGEFGISADEFGYDPIKHEKANREIIIKFLKWGCPYILYWEMYNNEVRDGMHRGFWLINDKNEKQPLYYTFQRFLSQASIHVADTKAWSGKVPGEAAFRAWAIGWLEQYDPATPIGVRNGIAPRSPLAGRIRGGGRSGPMGWAWAIPNVMLFPYLKGGFLRADHYPFHPKSRRPRGYSCGRPQKPAQRGCL